MKQSIIIFFCLMMVGIACKKRRMDPSNELHYKEVQCYNPWERMTVGLIPESDTQTIKNWLQENDITAWRVKITGDTNIVSCKACTCPSGRTIRVLFNDIDVKKAKALGFYQP